MSGLFSAAGRRKAPVKCMLRPRATSGSEHACSLHNCLLNTQFLSFCFDLKSIHVCAIIKPRPTPSCIACGMSSPDQSDDQHNVKTSEIKQLHDARSKLKQKIHSERKRSVSRHGPLDADLKPKTRKPFQGAESYAKTHDQLLIQLESAQKLPQNSTYARHRKACLQKALVLLELTRYSFHIWYIRQ